MQNYSDYSPLNRKRKKGKRFDLAALTGLETLLSNAPLPQNKNPHSFAKERILFWKENDKSPRNFSTLRKK